SRRLLASPFERSYRSCSGPERSRLALHESACRDRQGSMSRQEVMSDVVTVASAEGLQALSHPVRVRALEALREPASAASVARAIGQPRQKVTYHLKMLEDAGLVRRTGERRVGNFVESLYQAAGRTFIVAGDVAWGDPRRREALRAQHALE